MLRAVLHTLREGNGPPWSEADTVACALEKPFFYDANSWLRAGVHRLLRHHVRSSQPVTRYSFSSVDQS